MPNTPGLLTLAAADRAVFVSDIHLGEHDPQTAALFFERIVEVARDASHVVVLGDLFEAWTGDDQSDPITDRCIAVFHEIGHGRRLLLMRGNRDFLMDVPGTGAPLLSTRMQARMLGDPCRIDLFGTATLLSHGDAWCTDDHAYQRFRELSRSPGWQATMVSHPRAERMALARQLREQSEREKRDKNAYLMDVNDEDVARSVRAAEVAMIIHGHTHRPAVHEMRIDQRPIRRWVLPDWEAAEQRGGFLIVDAQGWRWEMAVPGSPEPLIDRAADDGAPRPA